MGWEHRNGVGRYYVRKWRCGDRIVSEYIGKGPEAEAAALADQEAREAKEMHSQARAAERRAEQEIDEEITGLADLIRLTTECCLASAGLCYHRGQWRRPRNGTAKA